MFDNLRQKSADEAGFLTDDKAAPPSKPPKPPRPPKAPKAARPQRSGGGVGISPGQRFLLALMLFINVTVLGCFALLVFEKIALPFF
ncbi:MAG: hypothetical protein IT317_18295 [Anaerolineales bacterium]|nr:hypothetical protein [Anaerolineales bacterium]